MNKVKKSIKWSALEKIFSQGLQLITLLILARILSPDSFGLIAMTGIFISIAHLFVDGGFTNALVRKGNPTEIEYSTAFYFNVFVGVVIYCLIFISSPFISGFYNEPILDEILKYLGIIVFINSFTVVHRAKLNVDLNFKLQSKVTISASLIGGSVGIFLALNGYGVWSLVFQSISTSIISLVLYLFLLKWRPLFEFDVKEFKDMFSYGSKLILSALIELGYANSFIIIIGKLYSSVQLGFFYQAQRLIEIPTNAFIGIVQRVNLPLMSKAVSDEEVKQLFSDSIVFSTFVFTPLVCSLIILSDMLFFYILGENWLGASKYLMILCFSYIFYPLHAFNLNLLQVKKRSDLFLKLEIIKKIIGITIIIISYQYGIVALCVGIAITSILSLFVNCYYTSSICSITTKEQFCLTYKIFIVNLSCLAVGLVSHSIMDNIAISSIVGISVFWILLYMSLYYILNKEFEFFILKLSLGRLNEK